MMMDQNPRRDMLKILSKKLARVIAQIEDQAGGKAEEPVEGMDGDDDLTSLGDDLPNLSDGMDGEDPGEELAEADPMADEVAAYMKGGGRKKPRDGTAVMIAGMNPTPPKPKRRGVA